MFSVIFTFADFQLVYVLTRGGPANATHLFATYAFDVAMGGGQLGMGASIALAMLPPFALIIVALSLYMKPSQSMTVERGGCDGQKRETAGASAPCVCGSRWASTSIFTLFPFYWMAVTSLKPNSELYNRKIMPMIVHHPTLQALRRSAERDQLLALDLEHVSGRRPCRRQSPWSSGSCWPIRWPACVSPDRPSMSFAVAATYLVPQPLLFIPLADIITNLGLNDTLTAVILTYPTLAHPVLRLAIDGVFPLRAASSLRTRRASMAPRDCRQCSKCFYPCARPGLISAGIFAFTLAQNEFLYALIFLTQTDVRTVPVGAIAELVKGDVFYWGQLMAAALLGSVPVAIIYSFFVEHYVAGLTAGAVKQ